MIVGHRITSAVDVANAALAEVGHPARAWVDRTGTRRVTSVGDLDMQRRAVALGVMFEHGPDYLVRCSACVRLWRECGRPVPADREFPRCTPARDILRGVRCGGVS